MLVASCHKMDAEAPDICPVGGKDEGGKKAVSTVSIPYYQESECFPRDHLPQQTYVYVLFVFTWPSFSLC